MTRRFIRQLGENENVDEIFRVSEKQLRTNRNGNLYLQMRLVDRTGTLNAMLWNANDRLAASFDNGDFVQVQGATQFYNGSLQMIVSRVEPVDSSKVNDADFATLTPQAIEALLATLKNELSNLSDPNLKALGDCFLADAPLMKQFCSAPAGIKNHHAYQGGLLEHVVGLIELGKLVAARYEDLDVDLLVMGCFLHDLGKTEELEYERELVYSDAGQLIGHLVLAVSMLDDKLKQTSEQMGQPFPEETALRLKHMIVSHHGQYEFGSPKLPMTPEAIALHYLDTMDSRLHGIGQLMREDANADSRWTVYHPALQRRLFKGSQFEP